MALTFHPSDYSTHSCDGLEPDMAKHQDIREGPSYDGEWYCRDCYAAWTP
ncbi:hypothetical protein KHQ84_gp098 [Rhodococcus phage Finch]|uniref:Uncharacterized protein n=1 Tax=Rhodococcus phage Finch TaxID=2094144 RepID=A0A2P1JXJ8_9CAUD|nr:hypothetical protein KHQ84_gp098 [Rhodococcus phage Finch]AVO25030.1 hypothetical protein SEA_FINCH_98 [Rhodococcus phage Finch]